MGCSKMKKILAVSLLLLATGPCLAQAPGPGPVPPPCSSLGTASGTCAQGGVISAGGPTGSATVAPIITYNAAGQLTTVTSATVTPAVGSITGLGTNVGTALGVNVGTAGSPVVNGGALGTPSSGTATNLTGTAAGLTAGVASTVSAGTGSIKTGTATSVGAGPTTIYTESSGSVIGTFVMVTGDSGTAGFAEIVTYTAGGTAHVVGSALNVGAILNATYGSPGDRTYTISSTALQLSIAAGTFAVKVMPFELQ